MKNRFLFLYCCILFCGKMANAQHGAYTEHGYDNASPLAVFDKKRSLQSQLDTVRSWVIGEKFNYNEIYRDLYSNANSGSENCNCPSGKTMAGGPSTAKDAAFVYLIGLNQLGQALSNEDRASFRNKALSILEKAGSMDKACFRGKFGDTHQYRSKELIMYLQAYDLLKTAKAAGLEVDQVRLDKIRGVRGKLKKKKSSLQYYTRNLYRKADNDFSSLSKYNNHSLMTAASLGMAAVVLNDASTRRKFNKNWQPERWAEVAHWHINRSLWTNDNFHQSTIGEIAGYAEGPHYFIYAFENLLPFFLAFDNFVPADFSNSYPANLRKFLWENEGSERIRNYMHDQNYDNLYQWYTDMLQPNEKAPSYDNTACFEAFTGLAILRKQRFSVLETPSNNANMNLQGDYLAALTPGVVPKQPRITWNSRSGNLIINSTKKFKQRPLHYFHLLLEPQNARTPGISTIFGDLVAHEHDDLGNFSIIAGDDILVMDPPYYGYEDRLKVNSFDAHNVVRANLLGSHDESSATFKYKYFNNNFASSKVKLTYPGMELNTERLVEVFEDGEDYYYVMTDHAIFGEENNTVDRSVKLIWNLNANGNITDGVASFTKLNTQGDAAQWFHPKKNNSNRWSLQADVAVHGSNVLYSYDHDERNGNSSDLPSGRIGGYIPESGGYGYGIHTRLQASAASQPSFLAVLQPYTQANKPTTTVKRNMLNYASQLLDSIGIDNKKYFHFAKSDTTTIQIPNPFEVAEQEILKTDAKSGFIAFSSQDFNVKNCISSTFFRRAGINNGKHLFFVSSASQTMPYISTWQIGEPNACFNKRVTTYYELHSKFYYRGFTVLDTPENCAYVTYFLPDLENGYDVIARNANGQVMASTYNMSTKQITIVFPGGKTEFSIELKNPCLVSCFFPPTSQTIDTLFHFFEGGTQALGHDLSIVDTAGHLFISDASTLKICSDYVLVNKSKLTMESYLPRLEDRFDVEGQFIGYDTISANSAIIVSDRAGLVLDSGSFTKVGANSRIIVQSGGTLLVKKGAVLEIGDEKQIGFGAIIAEDSSFVSIEEGAKIQFHRGGTDSSDRNQFFVTMLPSSQAAYAGVNEAGAQGQFQIGGTYGSSQSLPFCDVKLYNLPYGIEKPIFGWANFSYPFAKLNVNSSYCYGDSVRVFIDKTLNESKYKLLLYKLDPLSANFILDIQNSDQIWRNGRAKQHNFGAFSSVGRYKVKLITSNDCGEIDSVEKEFNVENSTTSFFTLATNSCVGEAAISANGSPSSSGNHTWSVERIFEDDNSLLDEDEVEEDEMDAIDYNFSGVVSNNFEFPGFNFKPGGFYRITLQVIGACGQVSSFEDSVLIDSFYVKINPANVLEVHGPLLGADPVPIIFDGYISNADSYQWFPTEMENRFGLNLNQLHQELDYVSIIAGWQPKDFIVLSACFGNCVVNDTLRLVIKKYANAGEDTFICAGSSVQLEAMGHPNMTGAKFTWSPSNWLSDSTSATPVCSSPYTQLYKLQVEYNGKIEFDSVLVNVHDTLEPAFDITYLGNQTFLFENATSSTAAGVQFEWDFGDGTDPFYGVSAIHQFPNAENEKYHICLTATNKCGVFKYWDSVAFSGSQMQAVSGSNAILEVRDYAVANETLYNSPNPMREETTFYFHIENEKLPSSILLTDMVGKQLGKYELQPGSNQLTINLPALAPGIYHYSLLVGELKMASKILLVIE